MESQPPNFETQLMNQTARGHFVSLVDLTCGRGTATSWTFGYLPNQKPTTIGISLKNHNNDFVYNATATQCHRSVQNQFEKHLEMEVKMGTQILQRLSCLCFKKILGALALEIPKISCIRINTCPSSICIVEGQGCCAMVRPGIPIGPYIAVSPKTWWGDAGWLVKVESEEFGLCVRFKLYDSDIYKRTAMLAIDKSTTACLWTNIFCDETLCSKITPSLDGLCGPNFPHEGVQIWIKQSDVFFTHITWARIWSLGTGRSVKTRSKLHLQAWSLLFHEECQSNKFRQHHWQN